MKTKQEIEDRLRDLRQELKHETECAAVVTMFDVIEAQIEILEWLLRED